jgi:hypothetical protein
VRLNTVPNVIPTTSGDENTKAHLKDVGLHAEKKIVVSK